MQQQGVPKRLWDYGLVWVSEIMNQMAREPDNFYTGLSPHQPCVESGFVFMSDQDCSQGYLVTGPMVGTYFSHGFGLYSCIFGVYPRLQWFPKLSPSSTA